MVDVGSQLMLQKYSEDHFASFRAIYCFHSDFWFLTPHDPYDPHASCGCMHGRPRENAKNASMTQSMATSSLKHTNGNQLDTTTTLVGHRLGQHDLIYDHPWCHGRGRSCMHPGKSDFRVIYYAISTHVLLRIMKDPRNAADEFVPRVHCNL